MTNNRSGFNKPRIGTPIVLINIYGRRDRYLLLETEGNIGIARDGYGAFQAIKRANEHSDWKCVKVPQTDETQAWSFVR